MNLKTGDPAPRFSLPDVNGETVALEHILGQKQHLLLVFLRHLG
jgi:peroxiredoxin